MNNFLEAWKIVYPEFVDFVYYTIPYCLIAFGLFSGYTLIFYLGIVFVLTYWLSAIFTEVSRIRILLERNKN